MMRSEGAKAAENLMVLQKYDSDIVAIALLISHAALYSCSEVDGWEKYNVEGPLFIVKRSTEPRRLLMIMNRLDPNVWTLRIEDMRVQIDSTYDIICDKMEKVWGLWVADKDERPKLSQILQQYEEEYSNKRLQVVKEQPENTPVQHEEVKVANDLLKILRGRS